MRCVAADGVRGEGGERGPAPATTVIQRSGKEGMMGEKPMEASRAGPSAASGFRCVCVRPFFPFLRRGWLNGV